MKAFPKVIIPNAVTALGLFCGYLSVINALHGQYMSAAWCILYATFLDALDGRLAKALHATTRTGAIFDSLSDLMVFGAAPAVLLYQLYLSHWGAVGLTLGFIPVLAGAARLARYTAGSGSAEKEYFAGLPIPIASSLLSGYVVFSHDPRGAYGSSVVAVCLIVLASTLMVSLIPYESDAIAAPCALLRHWKGMTALLCVASCLVFPAKGFFMWASVFIAIGLARWLWRALLRAAGRLPWSARRVSSAGSARDASWVRA